MLHQCQSFFGQPSESVHQCNVAWAAQHLALVCKPDEAGCQSPAPQRRPLDPAQQSRLNGGWNWVNVPQAILINQKASFYDCPLRCAATKYAVTTAA
jgi:hypothetical protein